MIDYGYVHPDTNNVPRLCLFVLLHLQDIRAVSRRHLIHPRGYELFRLVCDAHRLYSWRLVRPAWVLSASYWYPDSLRLLG